MPSIVVLGVNHRTAPLSLREKLAFDGTAALLALERLRADGRLAESLILSTCNRTELYAVTDTVELAAVCLRDVVCGSPHVDPLGGGSYRYALADREAVLHVLRVAAGLDSQILGEREILGQVKQAYALARRAGTAGPEIERLFETAIRTGRRARAETAIARGAVSVAAAALDLVEKSVGSLAGKSFLVIGAGDTGRLAARHIAERRPARLVVANRSLERARVLALEVRGEPIGLDALGQAIALADVVVSATHAPGFVVDAASVAAARGPAPARPLVLVDLAVPRDVDPAVAAQPEVTLLTVEGVRQRVDAELQKRRSCVPRVEAILLEELQRFSKWRAARGATPIVRELREHFERLRTEELRRSLGRFPPDAQPQVERLTLALVNKLLHLPMTKLRSVDAGSPTGRERLDVVRELFDLARAPQDPAGEAEHGA